MNVTQTLKIAGAAAAVSVCMAIPAQAVTFTSADIASIDVSSISNNTTTAPAGAFKTSDGHFSAVWPGATAFEEVVVSSAAIAPIAYAPGEFLKFNLTNSNENPWDFDVFLNGVLAYSQSIVNGTTDAVSIDLQALLGGAAVTSFDLAVSGVLPLGLDDRNAEFSIAAIPVPPALLLFGSGIAGLGMLARRRKNKEGVAAIA